MVDTFRTHETTRRVRAIHRSSSRRRFTRVCEHRTPDQQWKHRYDHQWTWSSSDAPIIPMVLSRNWRHWISVLYATVTYLQSTEDHVCFGFERHCSRALLHCFHGIFNLIESSLDDEVKSRIAEVPKRKSLAYLWTPDAHIMIVLITELEKTRATMPNWSFPHSITISIAQKKSLDRVILNEKQVECSHTVERKSSLFLSLSLA